MIYRFRKTVSYLLLFFFMFAVIAPHHAAAAENERKGKLMTRASILGNVKEFLKKDWEQTKEDMNKIGSFFKRDWQRTKEDYSAIKNRLKTLKSRLLAGKAELPVEAFRTHFHEWLGNSIDELGPKEFCKAVEKSAGSDIFPEKIENAEPQIARAAILEGVDKLYDKIISSEQFKSKAAMKGYCAKAEQVVNEINEGKSPDEVVTTLLDDAQKKASQMKASDPLETVLTGFLAIIGSIIAVSAILAIVAPIGIAIGGVALTIFVANTFGPVAAVGTAAAGVAITVAVFKACDKMFGNVLKEIFGSFFGD